MIKKIAIISLLIVVTIYFALNKNQTKQQIELNPQSVILAFGDSLTYGFGVSKEFSYPAQLEKKSALVVINAGISGEISSDGLKRLPSLLKYNPDLVILCHGANDILRRMPLDKTKINLLKMIELIRASGARVLLVGVPSFSVFGIKTHPLYKEVADESGVIYEDEIVTFIEADISLKSDRIHPNKLGYEMMADRFLTFLK